MSNPADLGSVLVLLVLTVTLAMLGLALHQSAADPFMSMMRKARRAVTATMVMYCAAVSATTLVLTLLKSVPR